MSTSGQKFVARNRAPRVQIEYDVELYGAEKKVQLPFVMGVMADLTGKSAEALPSVSDRKFLEIDVDNFDERLKSMKPRAAFTVPNTLSGEGNLSVDITFESLEDFSPAAIAKKVEPLRKLLEARTQLAHLSTYMDGKTGAEDLIARLIADPAALSALTAAAPDSATADADAALAGLREAAASVQEIADDHSADVLEALRNKPAAPDLEDDHAEKTLAALRSKGEATPDKNKDANASVSNALAELQRSGNEIERAEAETSPEADLAALLAVDEGEEPSPSEDDSHADVLNALRSAPVETADEEDDQEVALQSLLSTLDEDQPDDSETDEAAAVLESLRETASSVDTANANDEDDDFDLNALLTGIDDAPAEEGASEAEAEIEIETDIDLSASADADEEPQLSDLDDAIEEEPSDDLAAMLAELDDLPSDPESDSSSDEDFDLNARPDGDEEAAEDDASDDRDLDALLNSLDEEPAGTDDALSGSYSEEDDDDFASLLADLGEDDGDDEESDAKENELLSPFGTLSAQHPADRDQPRTKFRIALLGDFTGRASRGDLEIGEALARRKPMKFDIDNFEDVIARFATTLVLPIGEDGTGIEVPLNSLDDLHPDELYENVELFEELSALRQRVARDDAAAIEELKTWGSESGARSHQSRGRAKGNAVPADRKLSDFQSLIGDMQGKLASPSAAEDLIGHIVGPYVVTAADQQQDELLAAVDEALSGAMRTVLHHPDFQAVESVWRSLEFLARRVETNASFEIVLYDVSAEEWAADLATQDDLADSGLFKMLGEQPRLDEAQGPLSAVFALYTLEETPPHAELLARMSKISEWMNAPFVTAISAHFLDTPKKDRHPLVAKAWDDLRALPEAAYVGLAAPRFLLRLPYGAKTEPVDPFDFEEFTLRSGLKGMLWANPVILSATLLAATAYKSGKAMRLGEILSLGDIPVHTMVDSYGDQVALPCTERLLNTRTTAEVVARGFMPVLSIKGRAEIRQGSFQALGAGELHGPWELTPGQGRPSFGTEVALGKAPEATETDSFADDQEADDASAETPAGDNDGDPDLDLDLDLGSDDTDGDSADDDLDALLAGLSEDSDSDDDEEMDPELAALLENL